tara:strand:+ start:3145 stop:4509 length:1365 start_codon:yes stop_codon:yes gene_type:complete
VFVRWRRRVLKSNRGRLACRCEGFLYRESRTAVLVRSSRDQGKVQQRAVRHLGAIRSCCVLERPETVEAFLQSCAEKLRAPGLGLSREGVEDVIASMMLPLSELMAQKGDKLTRVLRQKQAQKRANLARALGKVIPYQTPVAVRRGVGTLVFKRFNVDVDELADDLAASPQTTVLQDAALKAQGYGFLLDSETRIAPALREEIREAFGAPGFVAAGPVLGGAIRDLLAAEEPERVRAATRNLRVTASSIRQSHTTEKIHRFVPEELRDRAFGRIADVMYGLPKEFGKRWESDLKELRRIRAHRTAEYFASGPVLTSPRGLKGTARADFESATQATPHVVANTSDAKTRSEKKALRRFRGTHRKTQTVSIDDVAPTALASLNERKRERAAAAETVRRLREVLTGTEAFVFDLMLDGASQMKVGRVLFPALAPKTAQRRVSRIVIELRGRVSQVQG